MIDLGFVGPSRPANDYRLLDVTDGDTPNIAMAIRMVSVDTPESEYGGGPATAQAARERTKARLLDGTDAALPEELRTYLVDRITPDAARRHLAAGKAAAEAHKTMVATRLARPDGSQRKLAVIATGELVEGNGRLLAYTAPWFTGSAADPLPRRDDPRRRTFNLDMVAAGWAATFVIYPSIPLCAQAPPGRSYGRTHPMIGEPGAVRHDVTRRGWCSGSALRRGPAEATAGRSGRPWRLWGRRSATRPGEPCSRPSRRVRSCSSGMP
jgi:endonuclease YncB( thermonuclease family)